MGCCDNRCCRALKEEFTKAKLGLTLSTSEERSDFTRTNIPLLVYRILAFLFTTIVWFTRVTEKPYNSTNIFVLAFFTMWTYTILVLYFAFAIVSTSIDIHRERNQNQYGQGNTSDIEMNGNRADTPEEARSNIEDSISWCHKAQWVFYNIATVCGIIVTLIYWTLLYPSVRTNKPGFTLDFTNVSTHAVNSVLIVVEIAFSSVPTRLVHVLHCVVYLVAYLVMSSIYYACGFVVYPKFIDWNYPQTTVLAILFMLVCTGLLQLMMFGIHKLKLWIRNNFVISDRSDKGSVNHASESACGALQTADIYR